MRHKKYKSAEELEKGIDEYFDQMTYKHDTGHTNAKGDAIIEYRYALTPSIVAMCIYLGISRPTLATYEKDEKYKTVIRGAYDRIEVYLINQLDTQSQSTGTIFNLKCNYGWQDTQKISADANVNISIKMSPELQEFAK